jgi:hypothetical protein
VNIRDPLYGVSYRTVLLGAGALPACSALVTVAARQTVHPRNLCFRPERNGGEEGDIGFCRSRNDRRVA